VCGRVVCVPGAGDVNFLKIAGAVERSSRACRPRAGEQRKSGRWLLDAEGQTDERRADKHVFSLLLFSVLVLVSSPFFYTRAAPGRIYCREPVCDGRTVEWREEDAGACFCLGAWVSFRGALEAPGTSPKAAFAGLVGSTALDARRRLGSSSAGTAAALVDVQTSLAGLGPGACEPLV
jgi:hypothetical protein